MKLLITGGLGFIGSNFILQVLKNTDFKITNVDFRLAVPGDSRRAIAGGAVDDIQGRAIEDTEDRCAVFDQADAHAELAVAFEELLGAVEGVDQPKASVRVDIPVAADVLLADDRDAGGELPQRGNDDLLRRRVGLG